VHPTSDRRAGRHSLQRAFCGLNQSNLGSRTTSNFGKVDLLDEIEARLPDETALGPAIDELAIALIGQIWPQVLR
jgi:hypothetical protein